MLKIINPANGELLKEQPTDNSDSINEKVARAKKAQPLWAARPYEERAACIVKFRDALAKNADELGAILTSEMGKPLGQARGEVNATCARIDFFLQHTAALLQTETVYPTSESEQQQAPDLTEKISYDPLGTIINISAWNYPYFVGSNVFVPALLTGNAVLYKPSEFSTLTGLAIARLLHESGIPEDVFIPVIGTGEVGAALLEHPLPAVFFTGSYPTGSKIAAAASKHLMKVQLELGGKDPSYICDDVDVVKAAQSTADGAFYNTGQSCCAVERIYVHRKIYDEFLEAFVDTVKGFKIGDPTEEGTYIGSLTRAAQLDFLDQQVADAKEKGARLLCGGARIEGKGNYYQPTVFADTNHEMLLMREETFGPLIGIQPVDNDEEAIALMNDTSYGLTAGVFTANQERATSLLAQLNSGSVYWNCCDRVSPRLPWTGRRHSGIGSTLSHHGIRTFLQPKAWHLRQA